jgi:hypothetical protein
MAKAVAPEDPGAKRPADVAKPVEEPFPATCAGKIRTPMKALLPSINSYRSQT